MIIPILLALPAAALPQQAAGSVRLEVRPEGAFLVHSSNPHRAPGTAGGGIAVQTTERWQDPHGGLAWIGMSAAVGDDGGIVFGGKELNNEGATFYAGGSATPLFHIGLVGAEKVRGAVAARATLSATLVHTAISAGNYQAVLTAYDSAGTGAPLWSYTFPAGGGVIAGEVMVSANGSRVVAVSGSNLTSLNMIRVFTGAGAPVLSLDLPAAAFLRQARLSDDGGRLYLAYYNGNTEILDTSTGANLVTWPIGATFDSHALSGDGKTFAYGDFGGLHVVRENPPGTWSQIAFLPVSAGGQYLAYADLDADGSHAAFQQQRYSPAYDHVEVGLFDVAANAAAWSDSHDAPGTAFQLVCSGVQVDEDGENVVGCTWGDSLNATPELFGYDSSGAQTMGLDLPGSAFALALDADGDVCAAGSKAVHANVSGNGGSIWCVEPYEPTLRLLGVPQLGGPLTLTTPAGASSLRVGFSSQLGASSSPYGTTEILLSALIATVGPLAVPPGGLTMNVNAPTNPALAGMSVHVQGVRFSPGGTLTNKVSLRLRP